jgi:putative peptidoglycan binding protein
MRASSTKRRPAGRRPEAFGRMRRTPHASLGVALGTLLATTLLAAGLGGPFGGAAAAGGGGTGAGGGHGRHAGPYRGDGMWIWYVSKSSGGDPRRIARKANRHGIETVYIKSSDGGNAWSQFKRSLISRLHSRGVRVCAWQFVYGDRPSAEAKRGAGAVAKGADCLVIDAESSYEGRYSAADRYVTKLRRRIGARFPIALAAFPYVDYHPGFPYSVFLGPRGARFNLPQVYWHTIGVSVGQAYRHTFVFNRVYRSGIYPLGQTYGGPPIPQIQRFRRMAISYGLDGVSWWSWQATTRKEWRALGRRVRGGVSRVDRPTTYPALRRHSRGDLVVWAQQHLKGAGQSLHVNGVYNHRTVRAVKRFQRQKSLAADGRIGPKTWRKLLREGPKVVHWSNRGSRSKAGSAATEPRSASLPAIRTEIPPPPAR